MRNRYEPSGEWTLVDEEVVNEISLWGLEFRYEHYVKRYQADCRDKQTGSIYSGGTYWVQVERPAFVELPAKVRSKKFYGELAWNRSAHYAADMIRAITVACEVHHARGRR